MFDAQSVHISPTFNPINIDTVKTCWQSQVLHKARGGRAPGCGEPCAASEATSSLAKKLHGAAGAFYSPLSRVAAEVR